jgi:hypothetical protein
MVKLIFLFMVLMTLVLAPWKSFQELLIFEFVTILCTWIVIWFIAKMFP